MLISCIQKLFFQWRDREDGVAAIEAALVFPIMLVLLLGVYDIGNAVLCNQKTIHASQIVADLITRDSQVDDAMIDNAITASQLSLNPANNLDSYGVDIVSIRFDENANAIVEWRETVNMTPNADVLSDVAPLASAHSGVVVVTVNYTYRPVFAGFQMGEFSIGLMPMEEVAFARGRRSAVVEKI